MKRTMVLALSAILIGCGRSEQTMPLDPSIPPPAIGPAPTVKISLGVGESPVEGEVFLSPPEGSQTWRYWVDLDEDGVGDREGTLALGIGFRYRFTEPGVHNIRVILTGPAERQETIDLPIVVNDGGPIRVLAVGRIDVDPLSGAIFEGIAMSHSGDAVYIASFFGGDLYRLDPMTLEVTGHIEIGPRVEGLAIPPSDQFLYAAFKGHDAASVDLASFTVARFFENPGEIGGFFIAAPQDGRALIGGQGPLGLIDMETGAILDRFRAPGEEFTSTWHFDISPDGQSAAVISRGEGQGLHIMDMNTLDSIRELPLGEMTFPEIVAFHPSGERLYLFGYSENVGGLFVVLDVETGELKQRLVLGPGSCGSFCVANPTATSLSGRYVAVEWQGGAYFIDTETDLPEHSITPFFGFSAPGFSVAASPVEDVFYFLRSDGLVQKIAIVK
jgi:DNA-binding beta-propeller fold protein YncE